MTILEWRNAKYNKYGTVDCEINHPTFGWIPFTANPDDTEANGVDTYNAIIADGTIAVYVAAPITKGEVDVERDRRLTSGFTFNGVLYQARSDDRENIAGASQVALAAIMNGAQPGDLYWHGGTTPFVWISADNSMHPMDAQTMFEFGKTAMAHKQGLIFKARALKDMDPIPANFKDDSYWS